jgi:hypothetical protein
MHARSRHLLTRSGNGGGFGALLAVVVGAKELGSSIMDSMKAAWTRQQTQQIIMQH